MTGTERWTRRLYRAFACALPEEFRDQYGRELVAMADDVAHDTSRRGSRTTRVALALRLLGDMLLRLVVEHWHDLRRDGRYAARMLYHSPGFTLAAAACLTIGIGLTAAMYAQIRSTVLRDLPGVREPADLVRLQSPMPFRYFEDLRDHGDVFAAVAAYMSPIPLIIAQPGMEPERIWGHLVTPDYFDVLRSNASRGRVFGPEERRPGQGQATVLSERLWRTRFGADPLIVGRRIQINGHPVTVVGIAAPGFLGASPTTAAADVWIPTTAPAGLAPELSRLDASRAAAVEVIGRLKPGLTVPQAEAALEPLVRAAEQTYNDPAKDAHERRVALLPGGRMFAMRDEDLPKVIGFPLVLVSLVLAMACGNVANMLLARSEVRRREIAVRLSLGAGRGRILRQLLTESLLLAALGALGGLAFARWLLSAINSLQPLMPGYGYFEARFDWRAMAVAVLLAAGSGVLFGLAPARRASRQDIYSGLKPTGGAAGRGRRWINMRNVLVFQQVAASVVLLLLTAFVVVGWQRSTGVDVGYITRNLFLVSLDPIRDGYSPDRAHAFFHALPEQLRRVPGVVGVSVAQTLPLAMSNREAMMSAKMDFVAGSTSLGRMHVDRVGAMFFDTVGIPVLRGRSFTDRDESADARVIVINDTMARQVWPGDDPIGRSLQLDETSWQVIGVVADIRSAFPLATPLPAAYRPITPAGFATPSRYGVTVAVRGTPGFDGPTQLRRAMEAIDPGVTVLEVMPMTDEIAQTQYLTHIATVVYGGMGAFGLLLACVGLAGVTAHAVARRTHEIGIRMALGARRADVLWLVLRESGVIVVTGTVAGLAAALLLTRALAAFVDTLAEATHTTMTDPLLLAGAPALLAALALAACYLPARRSTRINPVSALRSE